MSDERLVAQVRAGNDAAFGVLYDRHLPQLLAYCRHMVGSREDSEDVVQQAFASAHRGMVADDRPIEVRPWLYAIARNGCLSHLRKHTPVPTDAEPRVETAGLAQQVEQRDDLKQLLADIAELPEDQRSALILAELGGRSHAEIGAVIGIPAARVRALVYQARQSLMDAREAREADCAQVRELILASDGRARRNKLVRRHVRHCEPCAELLEERRRQRAALLLLFPVAPSTALAAAGWKGAISGGGPHGGGTAGGATAGTAGATGGIAGGNLGLVAAAAAAAGVIGLAGIATATGLLPSDRGGAPGGTKVTAQSKQGDPRAVASGFGAALEALGLGGGSSSSGGDAATASTSGSGTSGSGSSGGGFLPSSGGFGSGSSGSTGTGSGGTGSGGGSGDGQGGGSGENGSSKQPGFAPGACAAASGTCEPSTTCASGCSTPVAPASPPPAGGGGGPAADPCEGQDPPTSCTAESVDREFAPRFSASVTGDITLAGNSLLTCPDDAEGCAEARKGSGEALDDNDFDMTYVDTDGDPATAVSSSAELGLPDGAEVLFAGLYWGGDASDARLSKANAAAGRRFARLMLPGSKEPVRVTASQLDTTSWNPQAYQAFTDVTKQVKAAGAGRYTLAGVQLGSGRNRFGGWSLVVAYRDPKAPERQLTVLDGLQSVTSGAALKVPVTGLVVPKQERPATTVGVVAFDGDRGIGGDVLQLGDHVLEDKQSPGKNFFNSSNARNGEPVAGRDPSDANQLGFDSDLVRADGVLAPGVSDAAFTFSSSGGDDLLAGVLTLAIGGGQK